jgi:hypothetical protein
VLEDGFPVAEELHLICQNVKVFYQGLGKFVVIDISEWHDVQTLAVAEIREPQDPSTTLAVLQVLLGRRNGVEKEMSWRAADKPRSYATVAVASFTRDDCHVPQEFSFKVQSSKFKTLSFQPAA